MLSVNDTGIGMDKETRDRIFEPFFTTKKKEKGTGLGLSTVYGIVKQNGGFIRVDSEPAQGTSFKVYLPAVEGDAESLEKEGSSADTPTGSETILIVEDDEMIRKIARTTLQHYGYRILEAQEGQEALKISHEHKEPIHLIVTDVVMPRMSGPEFAQRMKYLRPETRVLYMSGYADEAIFRHEVLAPGVNFIEKPFSPEGLARKVREVIDK